MALSAISFKRAVDLNESLRGSVGRQAGQWFGLGARVGKKPADWHWAIVLQVVAVVAA
jgi:hypothetical protein